MMAMARALCEKRHFRAAAFLLRLVLLCPRRRSSKRLEPRLRDALLASGPIAALRAVGRTFRTSTNHGPLTTCGLEELARRSLARSIDEAPRGESWFVATALRLLLWSNDSLDADLFSIVAYGARSAALRRRALLALAAEASGKQLTDRLSVDVLRRAVGLKPNSEILGAFLEALVARGSKADLEEAVSCARETPPKLLNLRARSAAAWAYLKTKDLSARVIRELYLVALEAQSPESRGLAGRVALHLAEHLHRLAEDLQAPTCAALESWLLRQNDPESLAPRLTFEAAWKNLVNHVQDARLRFAFERAASRGDLDDFRHRTYPND